MKIDFHHYYSRCFRVIHVWLVHSLDVGMACGVDAQMKNVSACKGLRLWLILTFLLVEIGICMRGVARYTGINRANVPVLPNNIIFGGVKFNPPISDAIVRLGIQHSPSPIQSAALPVLCSGMSCILHAPTGSGKTFSYLLPALKKLFATSSSIPGQVFIVAPTQELAKQIDHDIHALVKWAPFTIGDDNISISKLVTSKNIKKCLAEIELLSSPIVVGTPRELLQLLTSPNGDQFAKSIDYLVLDEVDHLLVPKSRYKFKLNSSQRLQGSHSTTARILSILEQLQRKLQLIGVSATIGRRLQRELLHLTLPILRDTDISSGFPIIRPANAALLDFRSEMDSATKQIPKEICHISAPSDAERAEPLREVLNLSVTKRPTRYIAIPSDIKHFLYVDKRESNASTIAKKLSFFNKFVKKELKESSKRILLFLPTSENVQEAKHILRFWRTDNVHTVDEAKLMLENSTSSFVGKDQSPMIIVASFSGTRGLHIAGVDTVFVTQPPQTMDEYLHIAGRTGRLDCSSLPNCTDSEQIACRVFTVVNAEEMKRMLSWQTPLGIQLQKVFVPAR